MEWGILREFIDQWIKIWVNSRASRARWCSAFAGPRRERKGFLVAFDVRFRSYSARRCCIINSSAWGITQRLSASVRKWGWQGAGEHRLSAIGRRLRRFQAVSDKFGTKNLKSHLPAVFYKFMTPTLKLDIKFWNL